MAVELWWSTLAAADRDLLPLLDPRERARVESLERPADRGRSLVGAALLRVAAGAHLGAGPAEVVVDRTCRECGRPHGAPRIVGPGGPVPWVSVSHSGVLVAVALSRGGPVGIDVQRVSDLPDPGAARDWVRQEATTKAREVARVAGSPITRPAGGGVDEVTELVPPLTGYVAALTTIGHSGADPVQRHWP